MKTKSASEIAQILAQNVEAVAQYLFPNGKHIGNEWCIGSVAGESGESLKVCLKEGKRGKWSDFNTGQSGDLLNLWCLNRNLSIGEAIFEAKRWLGITSPVFVPQKRSGLVKLTFKNEISLQPNSKITKYLTEDRKLKFETLTKFAIHEVGNEIVFPYYVEDKLTFLKYLKLSRPNGKKLIRVSPNSEPRLFGWQAIPKNARSVVLVEGEFDAMSLHQYDLGFAVLSVPFGGGAGAKQQWVENEFDNLAIFDDIYLCLDSDEAGQAATHELIERLGRHKCRLVQLPYKDANECLQKDVSAQEIQKCFETARSLDPDELKSAGLFVDEVINVFYPSPDQHTGYSLPWQKTQGKILFRPSELTVWTGINGHGKSQFLGHVLLHNMVQGAKICIASLELKPRKLLMDLTRKAAGLREPTPEYIRAIHEWYQNRLWIFDLVGTAKTTRLIDVFRYARQRYGVDVFVIDSFLKCGLGEEELNPQKLFVEQLCDFKNQYDCHVHLVVHPRKANDETKAPGKLDIKGSGSISDLADNCFSIWRNKKKEEEIRKLGNQTPDQDLLEEADCSLFCDKQRNGEWEGRMNFWFNQSSLQYLEGPTHKSIQMVPFSRCSALINLHPTIDIIQEGPHFPASSRR